MTDVQWATLCGLLLAPFLMKMSEKIGDYLFRR